MKKIIVAITLILLALANPVECARRREIVQKKDPQKDFAPREDETLQTKEEESTYVKTIDEEETTNPKETEEPEEIIDVTHFTEPEETVDTSDLLEEEIKEVKDNHDKNGDEKESEDKDIYLNFDNADLVNFVNYISELKKINLVTDPKIAGSKVSLTIRDPLSVEEAYNIFLTVLEMSGFTIVEVGHVNKVVPAAQKGTEPLPTYINVPADTLPSSDLSIRFLTFLVNIPIDQVAQLVQTMLSAQGKIIQHPSSNGLIITDKSYNIKSAMRVVQELDKSDIKQSVSIIKLKQANATDVKKLFDSLMQTPEGNPLARLLGKPADNSVQYFPPTTKIIAEERTNQLILLGDQQSIKKIEDFIVKHVDTTIEGVKSPIHIYELKHADVSSVKEILDALINQSTSDSPAAKYGGIRNGVKYFKKMSFSADPQNNRLFVTSTDDQDWKLLKRTIKDLDKPQPQVAIETMVVAIDFEKTKQLGSQIRNKKHGNLGIHVDAQAANLSSVVMETDPSGGGSSAVNVSLLGHLLKQFTANVGSTILTFGKSNDIWATIQALQTQTNGTVLSQPFITTKNMQSAKVSVGLTKRLPTQKALSDEGKTADTATGYAAVDANLTMDVTPQINLDGVINLKIDVTVNDFLGTTNGIPDTVTKSVNTNVSVANGQVLALGGFVKTKVIDNIYKTPILNNIPILGWLFKSKKRIETKEYIFIFMSPTISKPRQSPGTNLYTKMKINESREVIDDAVITQQLKDPIHNWFFAEKENYSHKIVDFANARYQPTTVDIADDPYYRAVTSKETEKKESTHTAPLRQSYAEKENKIVELDKEISKPKEEPIKIETKKITHLETVKEKPIKQPKVIFKEHSEEKLPDLPPTFASSEHEQKEQAKNTNTQTSREANTEKLRQLLSMGKKDSSKTESLTSKKKSLKNLLAMTEENQQEEKPIKQYESKREALKSILETPSDKLTITEEGPIKKNRLRSLLSQNSDYDNPGNS